MENPTVRITHTIAFVTPVVKLLLTCRERERNVLFNDALNTFYLCLYDVRHMVKDHSDSKKGNPQPPLNGLLVRISSKGSFTWKIPVRISHTTAFVTPVMEHWLDRLTI